MHQSGNTATGSGALTRPGTIVLKGSPRGVGKEESTMRIVETKRTGICTCRCNACRSQAHCRNMGSGCKVKL